MESNGIYVTNNFEEACSCTRIQTYKIWQSRVRERIEEDYLVGKFSWFLVTRLFQSSRCNSKGGTAIPPFLLILENNHIFA